MTRAVATSASIHVAGYVSGSSSILGSVMTGILDAITPAGWAYSLSHVDSTSGGGGEPYNLRTYTATPTSYAAGPTFTYVSTLTHTGSGPYSYTETGVGTLKLTLQTTTLTMSVTGVAGDFDAFLRFNDYEVACAFKQQAFGAVSGAVTTGWSLAWFGAPFPSHVPPAVRDSIDVNPMGFCCAATGPPDCHYTSELDGSVPGTMGKYNFFSRNATGGTPASTVEAPLPSGLYAAYRCVASSTTFGCRGVSQVLAAFSVPTISGASVVLAGDVLTTRVGTFKIFDVKDSVNRYYGVQLT